MKFEAGTHVTPVVRLLRPLGAGGMGAVWVADHTTLRTEVVVKFVSEALASDPVSLARFSREASAAAAVKSPHVVQMLDHGLTEDGTSFIVMELLDGEDLRQRLARDGAISLALLGSILSQACKAVGRAHASGIVHRDIKPDNIFLCRGDDGDTFVKLLDFGIARSGATSDFRVTATGAVLGTPFYMSPEQAIGDPVDARTDLWSLGVVAFEAMTGTRPFQGATLGALTIAICNDAPPVPSRANPKLPAAVDAWLAKACARDPAQRFASAREMSDAFAEVVRAAPAPADTGQLAFQATLPSRSPVPPAKPELGKTDAPLARTQGDTSPQHRGRTVAITAALVGLCAAFGLVAASRSAPLPATAAAQPRAATASAFAVPTPTTSQESWVEIAPPREAPPPPPAIPTIAPPPIKREPPRSQPSASASCDPPFFFDAHKNKVFKPECLD